MAVYMTPFRPGRAARLAVSTPIVGAAVPVASVLAVAEAGLNMPFLVWLLAGPITAPAVYAVFRTAVVRAAKKRNELAYLFEVRVPRHYYEDGASHRKPSNQFIQAFRELAPDAQQRHAQAWNDVFAHTLNVDREYEKPSDAADRIDRITKAAKDLVKEEKSAVAVSRRLSISGTSINALVEEAKNRKEIRKELEQL